MAHCAQLTVCHLAMAKPPCGRTAAILLAPGRAQDRAGLERFLTDRLQHIRKNSDTFWSPRCERGCSHHAGQPSISDTEGLKRRIGDSGTWTESKASFR